MKEEREKEEECGACMEKGREKEITDSKSRQDDARHPSSFWLGHYQGVIKLQSLLFLLLFVSSFHFFSFRGGLCVALCEWRGRKEPIEGGREGKQALFCFTEAPFTHS